MFFYGNHVRRFPFLIITQSKSKSFLYSTYLLRTMELECRRCGHGWDYKGKSEWYATCPHCLNKVRIEERTVKENEELNKMKKIKATCPKCGGHNVHSLYKKETIGGKSKMIQIKNRFLCLDCNDIVKTPEESSATKVEEDKDVSEER